MMIETSGPNDEKFSGDDLEELKDDDRALAELLDEPEDTVSVASKGPQAPLPDKDGVSVEEIEKQSSGRAVKSRKRRLLFLGALAVGTGLLAVVAYLGLQHPKGLGPLIKRGSIPAERSLVFDSFVIPYKEDHRFTYVSLSVSFKSRNPELIKEMTEKKNHLRGIIYDVLDEEINRIKELPSLEQLKPFIIMAVNRVLFKGKVDDAYIMNYFAV